jgi:hypothetical protein
MKLAPILPVLMCCACAADLGAGADDDTGPAAMVDAVGGPNIGHVDEGDGTLLTTIDATSETEWVHLRLADGQQVDVDDPLAEDAGWDLGFLRFHVKLAGGISGSAGVEAAPIEGVRLHDVSAAPSEGWLTDAPDGDDDNEDPDYALRDWYAYDPMTHVLTPHDTVWAIRTGDGSLYALRIEGYYDDAGTSGHMQFRWRPIDAP